MPCIVDYPAHLEAADRERTRVAGLLIYVREQTQAHVDRDLILAAQGLLQKDYGPELCETLRKMQPLNREAIVYNARSRAARELANWWEDHLRSDARREAAELAEQQRLEAARRAWDRLSPVERDALGVGERP